MGYYMQYDLQNIKYSRQKKRGRLLTYIIPSAVIFALILGLHLGSTALQMLLFGEGQVTKTATTQMVSDIQNGMPLPEAVAAFCRYVSNGT